MTGSDKPFDQKKLTERLDLTVALQAAGLGVWEIDPNTRLILCDESCRTLLGLADDEPIPFDQAIELIHLDDRARVVALVRQAVSLPSNNHFDETCRIVGADTSRLRWVRFWGQVHLTPAGELSYLAGLAQEVTQQVVAQRQQRILETITASTPDLMYVFDLNYRFTYANQALLNMWGSSWEQSIGKGLIENGYEPWHAQMHEREIDQVVATRQSIRGEVSFPHATLGKRVYDYVFAPVFNDQGEVEAIAGTTRDVTDSRQAQELIRESEVRFRSLIEEAPVPTMLMVGPDHTIEVANQAMIRMLGKGASIVGQPATRAVPELAAQAYLQLLDQVYASGIAYEAKAMPGELVIDGIPTLHYFDFTYKPLRNPAGQVYGIISMAVDVSHQVQTQQLREESQRQLLALFEQSPVGLASYSADDDLVIQWANAFFGEMVARSPQTLIGKPLLEALPEFREQGFDKILKNVIATRTPFVAHEVAVDILREGQLTTIYVDLTYQPRHETQGKTESILVVATDVTQRVQARQKLEESETFLQSIVDLAEIGVYAIDLTTNQLTNSPRVASWYGLPEHTDVVTSVEAIEEPDQERVFQSFTNAIRESSDGYYNIEYGVSNKQTGQKRILRTTGQIIYSPDGKPMRVNGSVHDITSQRELQLALEQQVQQRTEELATANQALIESQQQLTRFIRMAPVAIAFLQGPDYVFSIANERYLDLVGRTHEQLIGKPLLATLPEVDTLVESLLPKIGRGESVYIHEAKTQLYKQGQPQEGYYSFIWEPYYQPDGTIDGFVSVVVDVTEQVLARQKVEESQRQYQLLARQLTTINEELNETNQLLVRSNENLQQFAYIASHDLQEPLRKVQSFGDLLISQYSAQLGGGVAYLERMQAAAARMSGLIRDLLAFSRIATQRDTSGPVSLSAIVAIVRTDLELVIEETGAVVEVGDLPVIEGDRSQLEQLFQNLLTNALKFHKPGQIPHVQVRAHQLAGEDLPPDVKPSRRALTYHRIDIQDNGVGFDEKYLDRIFQVFQRLHSRKEFVGTGIGLAICEKVVTNHGGAISASSQPGQGATFHLYLPVQ